ncbi:type II toxin-antitoxin system Phd/YefM family antitoxin [Prescottella agglutinans]|uniref:Antitoxin YefM n=1 Tax=Prescottella agglutinans TaxID=1644129 RepID=A0ABT6M9N1_9NOCA|nr:type II toxin-antitoxin system prevent-host-death family antitoxin [Prescottella agglutinans]MDH6281011.1 antitoxin YefM [Prescottella agglutinans]
MAPTTVKSARKRLNRLVRQVNDDTVAIEIAGKNATAVLISRDRYLALQESTFLLRSPELMNSLRRAAERALRDNASATEGGTGKQMSAQAAKKSKKSKKAKKAKKEKKARKNK